MPTYYDLKISGPSGPSDLKYRINQNLDEPELCPVTALTQYLYFCLSHDQKATHVVDTKDELLFTRYNKSEETYSPLSSSSVGYAIRKRMKKAGIDFTVSNKPCLRRSVLKSILSIHHPLLDSFWSDLYLTDTKVIDQVPTTNNFKLLNSISRERINKRKSDKNKVNDQ
ncbi:hypothetical protein SAMD00019534_112650 [Acytostelium subglobosum LB1]|uniref:hypothetical protein n=1 Tax=Acytostelium subglobosum LB1 TaxID=1410327 RepID=UPI000644B3FB|nr:hypothetical protein SAMD00019534_112650 [Acytostelium subglobosum LB1]GAM28089.1 hypothetical protein SAMD00019534_112650 [Acytostelium subglobosum LB1]|eukprot:XP_012749048.1 hypothetical protein SAMD00019534_112650 [Acytostelium subglobosum LB1]